MPFILNGRVTFLFCPRSAFWEGFWGTIQAEQEGIQLIRAVCHGWELGGGRHNRQGVAILSFNDLYGCSLLAGHLAQFVSIRMASVDHGTDGIKEDRTTIGCKGRKIPWQRWEGCEAIYPTSQLGTHLGVPYFQTWLLVETNWRYCCSVGQLKEKPPRPPVCIFYSPEKERLYEAIPESDLSDKQISTRKYTRGLEK